MLSSKQKAVTAFLAVLNDSSNCVPCYTHMQGGGES